ncbi:dimethylamine monooxygenase subunit DmmA family protein [Arthrobacter sp. M4]|uniref:dimethylamine monooxygenase subunit DmmA family protein n=1 Tax=Arthrobacter sp. M4 TaxID=218160 RepID=UPI001CDB8E12|nr:dimethylamine monooxygenase subunit DmmA family protein [Arthrobacter sp. M4]MCA4134964.1 hypothetical protein [Arthrobacter sp. M4]
MKAFSSVPDNAPPKPPGRATEFFALSFGEAGRAAATEWLAQANSSAQRRHVVAEEASDHALATLRGHLRTAVVGLRVLIAGPEADAYKAAAVACEAGLVQEELIVAVTNRNAKRVFCPHCRTETRTAKAIGAVAPCNGCGRQLEIYHHFSRRTASYLGFMADAEEPRPAALGVVA